MEHIKKSKNISKSEVNSGKELLESTYGKIGMFAKLIQNHEVFHIKLEKFLKKEQPNYDVQSTKEASEFTVYNRAWSYIKKVSLDDHDDVNAIINFDPKLLYSTLGMSIKYFEEIEEYEKCSHLHNIQEIVRRI